MPDELYPVPDDLGLGATVRGFAQGQRLFDRYILQRILGRGGMGVVWLAHDAILERHVALKFLPELVTLDKEAIADLKRETRRSLELTHPHIVRIHDFVQDASWAGISMEYVEGETLSARKVDRPHGCFDVETLRPWVVQLCDALHYAHGKAKVVHRDLKPANLMVDAANDLKVADFGIARSVSDSVSRVTLRQGTSGTLAYMSPQQALGQMPKVTDDIYAFGATLYELLTGKPPFYRGDILSQVREIVPLSLAERRAELEIPGDPIPPEWEHTVAACLAKDPAQRPQSITETAEWLHLIARTAASGKPAKPTKTSTTRIGVIVHMKPEVGQDWKNSLGMKFVPAGADTPLFSVWTTRLMDYRPYIQATRKPWLAPKFGQSEEHPAVNVSWDDAKAFCDWLTNSERAEGNLSATQEYRLPTDAEWSRAVALQEPVDGTPESKSKKIQWIYPWGTPWPPPPNVGNYAKSLTQNGFPQTSPVGSFIANDYGLYDMGGNVWEWCEDIYSPGMNYRVLRGGAWTSFIQETLLSSYRDYDLPDFSCPNRGFRCVLAFSLSPKQPKEIYSSRGYFDLGQTIRGFIDPKHRRSSESG